MIGFIDGTVLRVARPSGIHMMQLVGYNGHKRKHGIKFQIVSGPDGMVLNCYGPMEDHRHELILCSRSSMDEELEETLSIHGRQFCVFEDSGYNRRWFLDTTWKGASLTAGQKPLNKAMPSLRVKVEWIFNKEKQFFPMVDFKRKMKIEEAPVACNCKLVMKLSNVRNCL